MDRYEIAVADPDKHAGYIHAMIKELAVFERMPDGPKQTAADLSLALKCGACHSLVALERKSGIPIAYSIYYYGYSTWNGRIIFMEDLFVQEAHRNNGIGKCIWREIAKICRRENVTRMCWNVLDWNQKAIEFYKRMNAVDVHATEGWVDYRLYEDEIRALADGDT